jgi:hypothetical protein
MQGNRRPGAGADRKSPAPEPKNLINRRPEPPAAPRARSPYTPSFTPNPSLFEVPINDGSEAGRLGV